MKLDSGAYRRGTVTAVDEREVEEAGDLDQGRELLEGSDARAGEREHLQVAQRRDAVDALKRVGLRPRLFSRRAARGPR